MKTPWWQYRQWAFAADMNADGAVNLADARLWVEWLFLMPGDALIALLGPTPYAQTLGLTPASFGSATSAAVSAALWLLAVYLRGFIVDGLDPTYRQEKREQRAAERARNKQARLLKRRARGGVRPRAAQVQERREPHL